MACHEIAALRLSLMNLIGSADPAERQHELLELGAAAERPGPLSALLKATDLSETARLFSTAIVELNERVSRAQPNDPKLPYYRTLLVLTRKVELELRAQVEGLARWNRELDEMHDFVHEIYPAE